MKNISKILAFIFISLTIQAQSLDTVINKTFEDFLLHDTVYVAKVETVNIAKPETIKTKSDSIKRQDSSLSKFDLVIPKPHTTAKDSSFFNFLKIVGEITFWTILEIVFIILIGIILIKLLDKFKNSPLAKERLPFLQTILVIARLIIWIFIFYLILNLLIGDTKEVALVIIVISIIIFGVASIPLIRNFIGGIFISIVRPFEVGNFIKILDNSGQVQSIGWRSTKIISGENNVVYVPNSLFLTNSVANINIGKKEQLISLEFEFPAEYNSNYIISVLRDSAISSPYAYGKKEVKVFLAKADFITNTNKYKVNVYIFDSRFENELSDSINSYILNELNKNLKDDYNL